MINFNLYVNIDICQQPIKNEGLYTAKEKNRVYVPDAVKRSAKRKSTQIVMIAGLFTGTTKTKNLPKIMPPEKPFTPKGKKTGNARAAERSMGLGTIRSCAKSAWKKAILIDPVPKPCLAVLTDGCPEYMESTPQYSQRRTPVQQGFGTGSGTDGLTVFMYYFFFPKRFYQFLRSRPLP